MISELRKEHTSLLVGLKKNIKKSRPTNRNFEDHAIGNTHIFFLALLFDITSEFEDLKIHLLFVLHYFLVYIVSDTHLQ